MNFVDFCDSLAWFSPLSLNSLDEDDDDDLLLLLLSQLPSLLLALRTTQEWTDRKRAY